VDRDGPNASSILGVESLLIFGEVVVDGVRYACRVDNGISVQNVGVVSLEAVVAVEAVQLHHAFSDGAVRVHSLLVFVVVVEVICNLDEREGTLAIWFCYSFFLSSSAFSLG